MMSVKSKILASVLLLGMGLLSACSSSEGTEEFATPSKSYKVMSPLRISVKGAGVAVAVPEYHKIWDGDFPAMYKSHIPADISSTEQADIFEALKSVSASQSVRRLPLYQLLHTKCRRCSQSLHHDSRPEWLSSDRIQSRSHGLSGHQRYAYQ